MSEHRKHQKLKRTDWILWVFFCRIGHNGISSRRMAAPARAESAKLHDDNDKVVNVTVVETQREKIYMHPRKNYCTITYYSQVDSTCLFWTESRTVFYMCVIFNITLESSHRVKNRLYVMCIISCLWMWLWTMAKYCKCVCGWISLEQWTYGVII